MPVIQTKESGTVSTYLINHLRIPGDVPSEAGLTYLENVDRTIQPYGGRWLAMGAPTVVEGAWPGSAVLMEFPDRESAEAWYRSEEYQQILPLRTGGSIADLVFIDSADPGFTAAGFAASVREAIAAAH